MFQSLLSWRSVLKNARNGMLKRIKADIELDKMICEMEGYNFNEYLMSIKNLIETYL